MRGNSIRRLSVRVAVTSFVVAGALVGAGGLAAADEDGHVNDTATVDVAKSIAVDLGKVVELDVEGDVDADLGKDLEVDIDKDIDLDLGKKLGLGAKVDLGLKLW